MTALLLVLLFISAAASSSASPRPVDVGVILDPGSPVGQTCHVSVNLALADFYSAHPNYTTAIRLHFRHSDKDDVISTASAGNYNFNSSPLLCD